MASLKSKKALFGLMSAGVLGCIAAWVLKPGAASTYLELQASSDTVHRFTLVALPLAIVFAIISGVLAYRLRNRFRYLLVGFDLACLVLVSSILTYTLSFDASLETHGLVGQFKFGPDPSVHPSESGSFLALGDTQLWLGGGAYEDDTVLLAIALDSGQVRWSYHCLGNRAFPPAVEGADLAFITWRPSTSAVVLMWWHEPRLTWAVRIDTPLVLPPRFTPAGIEVATGDEVLLLARGTGQLLKREPACEHPAAVGVACQAGQVIAWIPKETP
jgi:hypothetical protein